MIFTSVALVSIETLVTAAREKRRSVGLMTLMVPSAVITVHALEVSKTNTDACAILDHEDTDAKYVSK